MYYYIMYVYYFSNIQKTSAYFYNYRQNFKKSSFSVYTTIS
jgi:hypothetical protein